MSHEEVRCEEDMPCWSCAEMGNQQCGDSLLPPYEERGARGELPNTGGSITWPLVAGISVAAVGGLLWAVSRKRAV